MDLIIMDLITMIMRDGKDSLEECECGGSEYEEAMDMLEHELRDIVGKRLRLPPDSIAVKAYIPKRNTL